MVGQINTLSHTKVEHQISANDGRVSPDRIWVAGRSIKSRLINKSQIASSTRHASRRVDGNFEHNTQTHEPKDSYILLGIVVCVVGLGVVMGWTDPREVHIL